MFPVRENGWEMRQPARGLDPLYLREMPVQCAKDAGFPQHGYVPELAEVAWGIRLGPWSELRACHVGVLAGVLRENAGADAAMAGDPQRGYPGPLHGSASRTTHRMPATPP